MKKELSQRAKRIVQWVDSQNENPRKKPLIIAIDGNSAAGKSELAKELSEHLSASLIHMDDFFLRDEQKSESRQQEIGGNIDYERFMEEVVKPLNNGQLSSYRRYDCASQSIAEEIALPPKDIIIVEGVYSLHPYFGKYYDLSVFLATTPLCQACRIKKRDGKEKYLRYKEEWIPKENAYFDKFEVRQWAHFLFNE